MAIFKCTNCGNLHGAAVETCGMCHSAAIEQVHEEPTTPGTLPPSGGIPPEFAAGADRMVELLRERLDDVAEGLIDFLHSGSTFFRAGADWFRSNTDTVRDPASPPNPELRSDKWPESPKVEGKASSTSSKP